ncbi:hypothetical protein [Bacillus sp. JCM 19041]
MFKRIFLLAFVAFALTTVGSNFTDFSNDVESNVTQARDKVDIS